MRIRIPKTFFRDHEERDLPTPAYAEWRGGIVLDTTDPAFPELMNDATHYATDGCDCAPSLKRAARNLIKAVAVEIRAQSFNGGVTML